jgi:hypothetical protein
MKTFSRTLLLFLSTMASLFAQNAPPNFELHIRKTAQAIKLDGILDEPAWQTADIADHFKMTFPVDSSYTKHPTEIRMCFDDKFLYVSAKCTQERNTYTVQSLKRDFPNGTSDVFNFIVDPFKDGLNGFLFSLNPLNVQREALIDNGANLSYEWDNKWYSAIQNEPDFWSVEMAIPFKTLRYTVSQGQNSWHINFLRTFLKTWEVSTWRPIPQQFAANNLAFTGNLIWETPPPDAGVNFTVIPYINSRYGVDYQRNEKGELISRPASKSLGIGGDAKIAVTPSLNLDLTINPDFSQVEVDRQVPNLSRFELFFPERRQFFLENRDLFATFGFPSTRPFFSRRIGLARNPITGNNTTVPILAGARLSGKINDNWRIGLLNMQTKRVNWDTSQVLPGANFAVATVQRKVGSRSNIGAILVDKENLLSGLRSEQKSKYEPWNRMAGIEYDLYSKDNRWEGEWYYHRSFSPDPKKRGGTLASFLSFNNRHFSANLAYLLVDSNYTADVGYVVRKGVQNLYPGMSVRFYPGKSAVNTWGFGVDGGFTYSLDFMETDRDIYLYSNAEFKNQSGVNLGVFNEYTFLFEDFDPTNQYAENTQPLPGLQGYTYNGVRGSYYSSTSYNLQGNADFSAGEFFNGNLFNISGSLSYRWQPYGVFALSYNYNRIRLPQPYASRDFWLIGPRAELSFTRKLFISAFFQYNTQINNFNINMRLQWRFAPVSDLFLVYTDNSYAEMAPNSPIRFFAPKNKALVLKAVYWLNL